MPAEKPPAIEGSYDIYPVYNIGNGKIFRGLAGLVEIMSKESIILLDGYVGVFFDVIREQLDSVFLNDYGISPIWVSTRSFQPDEEEVYRKIEPFLGADDPLFGSRARLRLSDFYSIDMFRSSFRWDRGQPLIIYGPGAALFHDNGFLVYFDLPKNELHYRTRAGKVLNLGASSPDDPGLMYKRFYFVDWVVLNNHKESILDRIDILADSQRRDDITWITGVDFRNSLHRMTGSAIRARPWFEPGVWGGNWIMDNIKGVNRNVPNYAWSYELITPENGLILESSGLLLEFSFDFLMYYSPEAVLGDCHSRYGNDFPIRFDFLDTFNGGNLSIQVHPTPDYIKENFGESFTQEESYYILDSKEGSGVYLGLRENSDRIMLESLLEESRRTGKALNIEEIVQFHLSGKHDLFLIPYGTIHGSGSNNLVLEISTTPYIFTFKLYDWVRPDLNGKPRALNVKRGIDNLSFSMKGTSVPDELIKLPELLESGKDWQLYSLPTHPTHSFGVYRYVFQSFLKIFTKNKLHVLNLTGGSSIKVKTLNGEVRIINYAETFVIPAAAYSYEVYNRSDQTAVLIVAFIR